MPLAVFLMNMYVVVIALLIRREIKLKKIDKYIPNQLNSQKNYWSILNFFIAEYFLILYKDNL